MKYLNVSQEIFLNGKKVIDIIKINKVNLLFFLIFFITEIIIGKFADSSGWIRCYAGDILIMPLMYFFIRVFTDLLKKSLPVLLLLFAFLVEFLQNMDICGFLGIDKKSLLAVIIGTKGDLKDIICYIIGTVFVYVILFIKRRFDYE